MWSEDVNRSANGSRLARRPGTTGRVGLPLAVAVCQGACPLALSESVVS